MTIAFTPDELGIVADALRLASEIYAKDVATIPEYHYKLREQFADRSRDAYELARRIEENEA